MKEELIIQNSKKMIKNTLKLFSDRLPPLEKGDDYINEMSLKFSLYSKFITLSIDNEVIGFAAFYCNDNISKIGFLSMIAVSKEREGNGYGQKLIDEIITICKNNNMEYLKLEVNKSNYKALNFYKKNSFAFTSDETEFSYFMIKKL